MTHRPTHRSRESHGIAAARVLLKSAGLTLPLIPEELAPRFKERGKWCFASRPLPMSPYNVLHYTREAATKRIRNYVVVAHDGHGVSSYAMHYYLVRKPLYLFLQVGWGGVYMDEQEATADVNDSFALAGRLVRATERAVRAGRLRSDTRLMIVASNFEDSHLSPPGCDNLGVYGARGNEGRSGAGDGRHFGTPAEALHEALRLLAPGSPGSTSRRTSQS